MIEKAREEEIFCREDTPTERRCKRETFAAHKSSICERVVASFLYYAGLSYRDIEPVVDRSYEAVRQWYHRLSHLFEPETDHREVVAVDETKLEIDGVEVYVWAAVDVDTFEVIHVDVSKGRASTHYSFYVR